MRDLARGDIAWRTTESAYQVRSAKGLYRLGVHLESIWRVDSKIRIRLRSPPEDDIMEYQLAILPMLEVHTYTNAIQRRTPLAPVVPFGIFDDCIMVIIHYSTK
jgi:hypothetical protein